MGHRSSLSVLVWYESRLTSVSNESDRSLLAINDMRHKRFAPLTEQLSDHCPLQKMWSSSSNRYYLLHLSHFIICVAMIIPVLSKWHILYIRAFISAAGLCSLAWYFINYPTVLNVPLVTMVGVDGGNKINDQFNITNHTFPISVGTIRQNLSAICYKDCDVFVYMALYVIINSLHLVSFFAYRYIKCKLGFFRMAVYGSLFTPLDMDKEQCWEFLKAGHVRRVHLLDSVREGDDSTYIKHPPKHCNYAMDTVKLRRFFGCTYSDEDVIQTHDDCMAKQRCKFILTKSWERMNRSKFHFPSSQLHYLIYGSVMAKIGDRYLHDIQSMQFVNSVEWELIFRNFNGHSATKPFMGLQTVYIPASKHLVFLSWDKELLYRNFCLKKQNKHIGGVNLLLLKCLLGADILQKLFSLRNSIKSSKNQKPLDKEQLLTLPLIQADDIKATPKLQISRSPTSRALVNPSKHFINAKSPCNPSRPQSLLNPLSIIAQKPMPSIFLNRTTKMRFDNFWKSKKFQVSTPKLSNGTGTNKSMRAINGNGLNGGYPEYV